MQHIIVIILPYCATWRNASGALAKGTLGESKATRSTRQRFFSSSLSIPPSAVKFLALSKHFALLMCVCTPKDTAVSTYVWNPSYIYPSAPPRPPPLSGRLSPTIPLMTGTKHSSASLYLCALSRYRRYTHTQRCTFCGNVHRYTTLN